jgi:signal transduction histidine kinase/ligand-binding sensor domain-containing protein
MPFCHRILKRVLIVSCCLAADAALAQAPHLSLPDYHHTIWTTRDGAPGSIWAMAQTTDGWLWLGTNFGLYRFDGISFARYTPPAGARLLGDRIRTLHALENGDLLIAYEYGGLTLRRRDGTLVHLTGDRLRADLRGINQIAADQDGSLWLATGAQLYRYANGKLLRYGPEQGYTGLRPNSIAVDGNGQVWISDLFDVFLLDRARNRFQKIAKGGPAGRGGLVMSPDGQVWFETFYGKGLVRLPDSMKKPRPSFATAEESSGAGMFDRHGNLWQVGPLQGVTLVGRAQSLATIYPERDFSSKLSQPWQLSSVSTTGLLEDRNGNIWVSTMAGLERLRQSRLQAVGGAPTLEGYSAASDGAGNTWLATPNAPGLWCLPANGAPAVAESGEPFAAVAIARDGALLLAAKRFLERRQHGKVVRTPFPDGPDGKPRDWTATLVMDDGVHVWVRLNTLGLLALVDGHWAPAHRLGIEGSPVTVAPGRKGQLWTGYGDGQVTLYDNGRKQTYASELGTILGLHAGHEVLAGGERGLAVLQAGRFQPLKASDPEVLRYVTGMASTPDGDRWFNGGKGLVHVRNADWRDALANPAAPLRYELLDNADGYLGQTATMARLPSIAPGPQGSLLIMTSAGLLRLPAGQFQARHPAPSAEILRLSHHAQDEQSRPGLNLAPGTDNFSIAYTALDLGRPEHLHFQYQLEGVDGDWQDAGTRRIAYYTNITPGNYRFRVRAAVDNGPWSDDKTELAFTVLPTLTQTLWFRAACGLALLALLSLAYKYRVRVVTRRLEERLEVRTAERERIARTLHDTILQGLQALILRMHTIGATLPGDSTTRRDIDRTLEQAESVLVNGRDEVQGLRDAMPVALDVALAEIGRSMQNTFGQPSLEVKIEGVPRQLINGVAYEMIAIAREAIYNAGSHAGADRLTAQIVYAKHWFTLAVSDNGRGIPPELLRAGCKEGHWGLAGMRERAKRSGGTLAIDSSAGNGTTVTLRLPARAAYKRNRRLWYWQRDR